MQVPARPLIETRAAVEQIEGAQGHVHIRLPADLQPEKPRIADADDFHRMAVDRERPANGSRRAAQLARGESATDHHDAAASADIVGRSEHAPGYRPNAEDIEHGAAHEGTARGPDDAAVRQIEGAIAVGERTGKDVRVVPDVFPDRIREIDILGRLLPRVRSVARFDHHELLRIADRKRPQHDGIGEGEDRGVGAES